MLLISVNGMVARGRPMRAAGSGGGRLERRGQSARGQGGRYGRHQRGARGQAGIGGIHAIDRDIGAAMVMMPDMRRLVARLGFGGVGFVLGLRRVSAVMFEGVRPKPLMDMRERGRATACHEDGQQQDKAQRATEHLLAAIMTRIAGQAIDRTTARPVPRVSPASRP